MAARGKGRLLLDVPVPGMGAVIGETFRRLGMPFSVARIATWNDAQRLDIAAHMPGAAIFQADGPPKVWPAGYFSTRQAAGIRAFDIGQWPPGFVQQAREANMPVWVWTINDPQTMRDVIREGVDGFETDVPRTAIAIAREQGVRP
jgi:glycerophosphoryl diester phosphodiesterase